MGELVEFESRHVKPIITYLLCMFKKIEENVTDREIENVRKPKWNVQR